MEIAKQLGASGQTIDNWRNQDRVDRGLRPGVPTAESAELAAARRRISELETNSGLRTPQALAQPSPTPVGGTAGGAVRWPRGQRCRSAVEARPRARRGRRENRWALVRTRTAAETLARDP